MKLLWMTDLHLEQVEEWERRRFFGMLGNQIFDAAVITGDISHASRLCDDLIALGKACAPRPIYVVLGNHDFHGSSFEAVDAEVGRICEQQSNLHHLGRGEIIPLDETTALIGHRGWADARAGYGKRTRVGPRDATSIKDFVGASPEEVFDRMTKLGVESGRYFRKVLPYALTCYNRVFIATHVPPFEGAALYNGRLCGPLHLPRYANIAAGYAIRGIANQFRGKRLTVLCGHTHSPVVYHASETVEVRAGCSKRGRPQVQDVFTGDI